MQDAETKCKCKMQIQDTNMGHKCGMQSQNAEHQCKIQTQSTNKKAPHKSAVARCIVMAQYSHKIYTLVFLTTVLGCKALLAQRVLLIKGEEWMWRYRETVEWRD